MTVLNLIRCTLHATIFNFWVGKPTRQKLSTILSPIPTSKAKHKQQHSGLQKEVLSLYRTLLRASLRKDRPSAISSTMTTASNTSLLSACQLLNNIGSTTNHTRTQFRASSEQMTKRELDRIEYAIRRGKKFVKLLEMEGVQVVKQSSR